MPQSLRRSRTAAIGLAALLAALPAGGVLAVVAPGGVTIEGDVVVTGKLTASDDVLAGEISLKTHRHPGVQTGGGQTGTPS